MAGLSISDVSGNYFVRGKKAKDHVTDKVETVYLKITFDSSYPTGGEALDLTSYSEGGATEPFFVTPSIFYAAAANKEYRVSYDDENGKLVVYDADSEVANATNLSALIVYLECKYRY